MMLLSCAFSIAPNLFTDISVGDNFTLFRSNTVSTKRGEKYDEAKDPALRKGTENYEVLTPLALSRKARGFDKLERFQT